MSGFTDVLLHAILPNRCMFCGKPVTYDRSACPDCFAAVPRTDPNICLICGEEVENCICTRERNGFDWYISPYYYGEGVDRAISDFKFRSNWLTGQKLAAAMARHLCRYDFPMKESILIPVPLYRADKRRRGFNQSEKMCKWISEKIGIRFEKDVLYKKRKTKQQHTLKREARLKNLENAFAVRHSERIKGKRVILVDDVFTTGSTIRVCARELYWAGAAEVGCITTARVRKSERIFDDSVIAK